MTPVAHPVFPQMFHEFYVPAINHCVDVESSVWGRITGKEMGGLFYEKGGKVLE